MEIAVCHDLKTERREVSQGLPPALRFVPFAFYGAAVFCTAASIWFWTGQRGAQAEAERWATRQTQLQGMSRQLDTEKTQIEALNKRAEKVAAWVEGSHGLQPLTAAISRSVGEEATIAEMFLTRNSEIPSQIYLTLRMDNATSRVLDQTLESIRKMSFRAYSAQSTNNEASLDYNATLVWQRGLDAQ